MSTMLGVSGFRSPTGTGPTMSSTGGNIIPRPYKYGRMANFPPEQMELFRQLFAHVSPGSYLGRLAGGDQSMFEQMEAPALKQFAGLQGNIASRFSGAGGGGRQEMLSARKSSGFQNTMNQAAQDFAERLQSNRLELQRQAIQDLMGMSESLLAQRPYQQFFIKKQNRPSFMSRLFGIGAPIAGAAIGGAFGGPAGAAIGGSLGGQLASGFRGEEPSGMDWSTIAGLPGSWS